MNKEIDTFNIILNIAKNLNNVIYKFFMRNGLVMLMVTNSNTNI